LFFFFFFQAEDGIRDKLVTGVQTCALPICRPGSTPGPACSAQPSGGSRRRWPVTSSARAGYGSAGVPRRRHRPPAPPTARPPRSRGRSSSPARTAPARTAPARTASDKRDKAAPKPSGAASVSVSRARRSGGAAAAVPDLLQALGQDVLQLGDRAPLQQHVPVGARRLRLLLLRLAAVDQPRH